MLRCSIFAVSGFLNIALGACHLIDSKEGICILQILVGIFLIMEGYAAFNLNFDRSNKIPEEYPQFEENDDNFAEDLQTDKINGDLGGSPPLQENEDDPGPGHPLDQEN